MFSECQTILGHHLIWGSFADESTWYELDEFLRSKWPHPFGGNLTVAAACIDAGDGEHYQNVMSFCVPKANRRIFAIKGMDGSRASGPPPRGLFEYQYKVEGGHLMIEGGQLPTLSTTASLKRGSSGCQG